jgi:hypothetical protein
MFLPLVQAKDSGIDSVAAASTPLGSFTSDSNLLVC